MPPKKEPGRDRLCFLCLIFWGGPSRLSLLRVGAELHLPTKTKARSEPCFRMQARHRKSSPNTRSSCVGCRALISRDKDASVGGGQNLHQCFMKIWLPISLHHIIYVYSFLNTRILKLQGKTHYQK
jgi:hypothetical protein